MKIKSCSVVISGGASGIGAETARYFAKQGAKVVILDRDEAAAQKVAKEINGTAFACDVTDAASVESAFAKIRQSPGAARVCINCAGIIQGKRIVGRTGPMPLEDFRRVIEVNLIGTFNVMRIAAAEMSQLDPIGESQERGVIINTSSVAAFEGQIGQAAYSASKGGIVSLTLPAARELGSFGIRVLAIAPGIVDTPMVQKIPAENLANLAAATPFPKRLAHPREYAELALHMVENVMLNGTVIRLDGALRMAEK